MWIGCRLVLVWPNRPCAHQLGVDPVPDRERLFGPTVTIPQTKCIRGNGTSHVHGTSIRLSQVTKCGSTGESHPQVLRSAKLLRSRVSERRYPKHLSVFVGYYRHDPMWLLPQTNYPIVIDGHFENPQPTKPRRRARWVWWESSALPMEARDLGDLASRA